MAITFTQTKNRSKIRKERRDHLHQLELPMIEPGPPNGPVRVWYWQFGKHITLP